MKTLNSVKWNLIVVFFDEGQIPSADQLSIRPWSTIAPRPVNSRVLIDWTLRISEYNPVCITSIKVRIENNTFERN